MPSIAGSTTRVSQHRQKMRSEGLRPIQFWVPDTRNDQFVATIKDQCLRLKNDHAEAKILRFTEEATSMIEGWE